MFRQAPASYTSSLLGAEYLLLKSKSRLRHTAFILAYTLLLAVALNNPSALAKPFVIAKISDNPKKHYGYLKPMATYLAAQLEEFGYTRGEVIMSGSSERLKQLMLEGRIDLITETLFTAIELQDEAGAQPLLVKWKKGSRSYSSVIFVRKDSDIYSLEDLVGKLIAFEDPASTSAYFLPAGEILRSGIPLNQLSSARSKRSHDKLNFIFTGEEINTTVLVHKKIVDAGAYSDKNWINEHNAPRSMKEELRVIHKTRQLPRALELVPKSMSENLKNRITHILTNIHKEPSAKQTLEKYQGTTRFEKIDDSFDEVESYARDIIELLSKQKN